MTHLLYTFRRCPYAIRARLAVAIAEVEVREVEVSLGNKPEAMLAISPKGTVPVLHRSDGVVLEESLDIMRWALGIHDPEDWLGKDPQTTDALIAENDGAFKRALDGYKYPIRFPARSLEEHRAEGVAFLTSLEQRLATQEYLTGDHRGLADAALIPFVRQFAAVDREWFASCGLPQVQRWLEHYLASRLFERVMAKGGLRSQSVRE